jgi:hypothetical protein
LSGNVVVDAAELVGGADALVDVAELPLLHAAAPRVTSPTSATLHFRP